MGKRVTLLSGQAQNGESKNAIIACNDWLRMGAGRSLVALVQKYTEAHRDAPPTKSIDTIKKWSQEYAWQERADAYDAAIEDAKDARRREIMESGLALDYERVVELKRMAAFLSEQIYEQGESGEYYNVWNPDVKQIGSGEFAERVDIERFNGEIFSQLRGTLDDLAKETGGRKQKTELTGANGGNIKVEDVSRLSDDERLARIAALLDAARARRARPTT